MNLFLYEYNTNIISNKGNKARRKRRIYIYMFSNRIKTNYSKFVNINTLKC